ncbi:MAG: 1-acyl-sn-glycerol-3-phosphate acyltransferase [Oscillatoriales cyanobacterium C42_A2020_001]|nr:1-acyl-sn-glycerol-3-phosphate acyltransferase [Leptolyngbyaceae cyanobacterium C42_A2020_001]
MPPIKFYPPTLNPVFTRICQSFSSLAARWFYRFKLDVDETDIDKLRSLAGERVVYLVNHPTHADGVVMFVFSARLGQLFHYIAAYESFKGWRGKFFQQVGAYSIRRGVGDRASLAQTLKVLQEPAAQLVIFPEGGCSYKNDTVMPFRTGAVDLSLRAMSRIVQQADTIPNFYLVPVSLKYRYVRPMDRAIERSLRQLEQALNLPATHADSYTRLRAIGKAILQHMEREFGLDETLDHPDWNQRIAQVKHQMVRTCEQALDIPPAPQLPMRERVYRIQSTLENKCDQSNKNQSLDNPSESVDELIDDSFKESYMQLYGITARVLNLDAIYDGYVQAHPTPERFLDTLITAEREVFRIDQPQPKGFRIAGLRVGTMINLRDYFDDYQQHREETVNDLNQQLQETVQANLSKFES